VTGVAEAGEVDGDDAVLWGDQRDELVKRPPALRKPVNEQDRVAIGAGGDVVHAPPVERGAVVGDFGDRGAGAGLRHDAPPNGFDN
jgi:hypothetical protein